MAQKPPPKWCFYSYDFNMDRGKVYGPDYASVMEAAQDLAPNHGSVLEDDKEHCVSVVIWGRQP